MLIKLSPQRADIEPPQVSVTGDILTLTFPHSEFIPDAPDSETGTWITTRDEVYDFSQLGEGSTLPADAIDSEWFIGDATRENGEVIVTLKLTHSADAPEETRFPQPINVTVDGPVELPPYHTPQPEPVLDEEVLP